MACKFANWTTLQDEARRELTQLAEQVAQGLEALAPAQPAPQNSLMRSSKRNTPMPSSPTAMPSPVTTTSSVGSPETYKNTTAASTTSTGPTSKFSIEELVRLAEISGPDVPRFIANFIHENCDEVRAYLFVFE